MSTETEEAAISRLASDLADVVIDNLAGDVVDLKAEVAKLRSAMGSIHAIATDLVLSHETMAAFLVSLAVERIRDKADEALATTGEGKDRS